MLVALLTAALALILAYMLWARQRHLQKWDHFPGPKSYQALPLVGHAYMLGDDPINALLEMQQKYGNVFRLDVGPIPNIVIAGLDEANKAFKSEVS